MRRILRVADKILLLVLSDAVINLSKYVCLESPIAVVSSSCQTVFFLCIEIKALSSIRRLRLIAGPCSSDQTNVPLP